MERAVKRRPLLARLVWLQAGALVLGACGGATKAPIPSSGASSAAGALGRLPASAFPAPVTRGQTPETGTLTFGLALKGRAVSLTTSAKSAEGGHVGTLTRSGSALVLRFTRLLYRVAPIRLPNGLTIASQTISLSPHAASTLRIDRRTGAVTSDLHWVVDAPNVLYNGSHTISLPDKGKRHLASFRRVSPGRYTFEIRSLWHASTKLRSWSVDGKSLPAGEVAMAASWNGYYVLTVGG